MFCYEIVVMDVQIPTMDGGGSVWPHLSGL